VIIILLVIAIAVGCRLSKKFGKASRSGGHMAMVEPPSHMDVSAVGAVGSPRGSSVSIDSPRPDVASPAPILTSAPGYHTLTIQATMGRETSTNEAYTNPSDTLPPVATQNHPPAAHAMAAAEAEKACPRCTFVNAAGMAVCEVCNAPLIERKSFAPVPKSMPPMTLAADQMPDEYI